MSGAEPLQLWYNYYSTTWDAAGGGWKNLRGGNFLIIEYDLDLNTMNNHFEHNLMCEYSNVIQLDRWLADDEWIIDSVDPIEVMMFLRWK